MADESSVDQNFDDADAAKPTLKKVDTNFCRQDEIDLAFDSIILAESIFQRRGFEQGSAVASDRDRREGFLLGVKKGFEIGSEVGFFQSFAKVWIKLIDANNVTNANQNVGNVDKKSEKVKRELEKLLVLAVKASDQNSKEEDIWQSLRQMRSKYTMICKLLKLDTVVDETQQSKEINW